MVGFQSKLKRTADAHVLFTMYMFCLHSKAKRSVTCAMWFVYMAQRTGFNVDKVSNAM